jgi:acetolactate synthase regulatory subunit
MTLQPVAGATSAVFSLWADVEPALLCRVLGLFAQHNVVPEQVRARRFPDQLQLQVRAVLDSDARATVIAAKIEMLVGVRSLRMEVEVPRAAAWAA